MRPMRQFNVSAAKEIENCDYFRTDSSYGSLGEQETSAESWSLKLVFSDGALGAQHRIMTLKKKV